MKNKTNKIPVTSEYKELYLMAISDSKSDSTRSTYRIVFDLFISHYQKEFLYEITLADLMAFKTVMITGRYSKHTINKYLSVLKTIYQTFMRIYKFEIYKIFPEAVLLADDPFKGVAFKKNEMDNSSNHFFVPDTDFRKMLSACDALNYQELYDILIVCRYLGLRKNEVFKLTAADVKNNHIVVQDDKTNSTRTVPLFEEAADVIKRRRMNSKTLFYYSSLTTLQRHFKDVVTQAGLNQGITLHTLRKTFGSALINDVPLKIISTWLGHASVKITEDWYIVLLDNDHDKWIDITQKSKRRNHGKKSEHTEIHRT